MWSLSCPLSFHTRVLVLLGTGACVLLHFWVVKKLSERNKRPTKSYKQIPTVWKQVGHVTAISLYPLKAGRYLSVNRAYCEAKGLSQIGRDGGLGLSDRCFILFNRSAGTYITNLQYGKLILVKVEELSEDRIQFSVHNDDTCTPLVISMKQLNGTARTGTVHTVKMYEKDLVHALDCGDEASQWFSTFLLGKVEDDIRLGYDCDEQRKLDGTIYEKYRHLYGGHMSNEDMGKYSYLASYMIMNDTSVKDLNERLQAKGESEVSMHNFRGNLIITTSQPYEEDDWKWLRINQDVILRVMKPCTRCRMTTLDPETGEFHPRTEPLGTLRSYRKLPTEEARQLEKHSPRLGLYCGLYARGTVETGDPVYAATAVEEELSASNRRCWEQDSC